MIETINHSEIEEAKVPACCTVEMHKSIRRKVVCGSKSTCPVKVCYFRDRVGKEDDKS